MLDNRSFGTKAIATLMLVWMSSATVGLEIRAHKDPYAPNTLDVLEISMDMLAAHVDQNWRRLTY